MREGENHFLEIEKKLSDKELFVLKCENGELLHPTHSIFVPSRDTGSANAIMPVVKELVSQNWQATVLSDGPAKQIFEANFPDSEIMDKPTEQGDAAIRQSELILTDASSQSGIEGCASWVMSDRPFVLIEDNYNSSTKFVEACKEQYGHIPDRICVIDEEAKSIILNKHPELEDRIVITGQPIYDRVAHENVAEIQTKIKQQLGLQNEDKLVVFAGTDEPTLKQYQSMLEPLAGGDFYFGFRKHPCSSFSYEDAYNLMDSLGIKYVKMDQITMDEAGAAADLVLTTWSTEGVKGIYRRKPTIHFLDPEVLETLKTSPLQTLPPIKLGASLEITEVKYLMSSIQSLLNPESELRQKLYDNMNTYYPADGKNTERVVRVVKEVLNEYSLNETKEE